LKGFSQFVVAVVSLLHIRHRQQALSVVSSFRVCHLMGEYYQFYYHSGFDCYETCTHTVTSAVRVTMNRRVVVVPEFVVVDVAVVVVAVVVIAIAIVVL